MKYAFMTFSCPELGWDEVLSTARRYGYDGVEPRIESGHAHGIELDMPAGRRAEIRRMAEDAGVAVCCIATSRKYADPDTAKDEVQKTLRCIDLAADIGSTRLRVFGGKIPEGVTRDEAADLVVASLSMVADHAAERGVTVCMETHDHWCNPAHVADIMQQVDHPSIAANWDIMHPVRVAKATMDEAFKVLRPWIRHVHFHDGVTTDGKLSMVPIGQGEIDHKRAVELLLADGYDGYLSGEWIKWEPGDIHLPRELETMREYDGRMV